MDDKMKYNRWLISKKSSNAIKANKLIPKKNGKGYMSSYVLSISKEEAMELGWLGYLGVPYFLKKEIVDGKLVISRGYPQTRQGVC